MYPSRITLGLGVLLTLLTACKEYDVNSELIEAAADGRADTVEALLAEGADANARARRGQTALMVAANSGHAEATRVLLDQGADPNAKTEDGRTALIAAAAAGHADVTEVLLSKGADLDARAADGRTAFIFAAENGHSLEPRYSAWSSLKWRRQASNVR